MGGHERSASARARPFSSTGADSSEQPRTSLSDRTLTRYIWPALLSPCVLPRPILLARLPSPALHQPIPEPAAVLVCRVSRRRSADTKIPPRAIEAPLWVVIAPQRSSALVCWLLVHRTGDRQRLGQNANPRSRYCPLSPSFTNPRAPTTIDIRRGLCPHSPPRHPVQPPTKCER